jgi:TPR repeat protein
MSFERAGRLVSCLALLVIGGCHSGPPPTVDALEKACRTGDAAICQKSIRALDERCYRRETAACMSSAALYLSGRLGSVDKIKAVAAYERGCEAGDGHACKVAGDAYGRKDKAKALSLHQKSCDLNDGEGCAEASADYHDVADQTSDNAAHEKQEALQARAVTLYEAACKGGQPQSCFGLGNIYRMESEDKAMPYYRQAMEIWQKRCDGGDLYGCYRVGIAYGEETGVRFDPEHSKQLLQMSCDKGLLDACAEVAQVYKGSDSKDDDRKAAELFEKACLAGIEQRLPCREGGFMYAEGDGVGMDKRKAAALFENGCNLGDDWCCFKLGTMLSQGDGITADAARAGELLQRGDGLQFRAVEVKRAKKMVDPSLTSYGIPESSLTATAADEGKEFIRVAIEVRRTADTAHLPVRKLFLVDAAGHKYENHSPGDSPFGNKPLERREYMFKVPAGTRPVSLELELGAVRIALPEEK